MTKLFREDWFKKCRLLRICNKGPIGSFSHTPMLPLSILRPAMHLRSDLFTQLTIIFNNHAFLIANCSPSEARSSRTEENTSLLESEQGSDLPPADPLEVQAFPVRPELSQVTSFVEPLLRGQRSGPRDAHLYGSPQGLHTLAVHTPSSFS